MTKSKWRGGKTGLRRARMLRVNATDAEACLWSRLRRRQVGKEKFRRQVPVGPYVVDFLCAEKRLIIEVDGGQHDHQMEHDKRRDSWLRDHGYRVIRFWNNQVLRETDTVLEEILRALRGHATNTD